MMADDEPIYGIDPIAPAEIGPRLRALLDRLEPALDAATAGTLRSLLAAGDHAAVYARLDALTDYGTLSVGTATLVELVLLGQAIRG